MIRSLLGMDMSPNQALQRTRINPAAELGLGGFIVDEDQVFNVIDVAREVMRSLEADTGGQP